MDKNNIDVNFYDIINADKFIELAIIEINKVYISHKYIKHKYTNEYYLSMILYVFKHGNA